VSPAGIPFGAADGRPTRLFFLVLSSPRVPSLHIQVLAQVSRLARTAGLKQALLAAPDRGSLVALVADAEAGERA
jgi:mannitol/fructose-specific phosphotransferase system IIA component (Ntr-type)